MSKPRAVPHASLVAVIADDFTGAAEIGGIALRQGLSVVVETSFIPQDTEVLIIAANTRNENPIDARNTIALLTAKLLELKPAFIYKKIDSVLRGNVGEELLEQMEVSKKRRALIIPCNPSLDRIIKNGIYYYKGTPLNRSNFTVGDEAKQLSPHVKDLIGKPAAEYTKVISKGDILPIEGLIIGNTIDETDLDYWAQQKDQQTVFAGGSSFFNALLKNRKYKPSDRVKSKHLLGQHRLYICGSAFETSRKVVKDAFQRGNLVAYLPSQFFCEGSDRNILMKKWADRIVKGLNENKRVIVAVDTLACTETEYLPAKIGNAIADVVEKVMEKCEVNELLIEGGSTAEAIIKKLAYQKFYPLQELAVGVIRMKVEENDNLFLTLKPGSYQWPSSVWA